MTEPLGIYTYPDIWEAISRYLDSDDLFAVSATCKSAYRAFQRPILQQKVSYPLIKPKRLTADQREVIRDMEKLKSPVKLISASVGAGKSIVSLAYALRRNFDKIFLVVPPNLIKMWWDTCKDFFGIDPVVMHGSNPNYRWTTDTTKKEIPESRVILSSYKIFDKTHFEWLDLVNSILIMDEAHHNSVYLWNKHFNEMVGLSATMFKRGQICYGIREMMERGGKNLEEVCFNLDKRIITSKLDDVIHLAPHKWKVDKSIIAHILKNKSSGTKTSENNLKDIGWISEVLSHPFLANIDDYYFGETLTVGRKKLRFRCIGGWKLIRQKENEFNVINPYPDFNSPPKVYKEYHKKNEVFRENFAENYFQIAFKKCVKYHQCLSILQHLKARGEKAIIFDNNVTYLPFLQKFLTENGMVSYMFTTHYDVTSRQKQLEKFKNDENANVLLSSIAMLGEGHNVTEANHVIFLSSIPDKNKYYQAIGRCHRFPQSKKVYVHYLFNSELDEKIYQHSQGTTNLSNLDWEKCLNE